jgi:hypothetical protein
LPPVKKKKKKKKKLLKIYCAKINGENCKNEENSNYLARGSEGKPNSTNLCLDIVCDISCFHCTSRIEGRKDGKTKRKW